MAQPPAMGLVDAVAAAAKVMAEHRQAMAEREQEIQRRMAAKRYAEKDRDAFVLAGDGTDAPELIRPGSFAAEQEADEVFELPPANLKGCPEHDAVVSPSHYNQGGIECLDAMRSAFGEDALRTYAHVNAFKYIWRARYKNGDEDLAKAAFYLAVARGEDPR
jgi:hypothetical protein